MSSPEFTIQKSLYNILYKLFLEESSHQLIPRCNQCDRSPRLLFRRVWFRFCLLYIYVPVYILSQSSRHSWWGENQALRSNYPRPLVLFRLESSMCYCTQGTGWFILRAFDGGSPSQFMRDLEFRELHGNVAQSTLRGGDSRLFTLSASRFTAGI